MAGATVAAITVPAALAYAEVAGLPPIMGLYAAMAPLAVFALLGSIRHQVIGPDASLSAVVAAALGAVALGDPSRAVQLAPLLALLVGVALVAMGIARLGFLANFLSRPMLAGFVAGLAVVILAGQLPKMLGTTVEAEGTAARLWETARSVRDANWWSVAIAAGAIVIMVGAHRLAPWLPGALVALIASILLVDLADLTTRGVSVLGSIPSGLPPLELPSGSWEDIKALVPGALSVVLVGFASQATNARLWGTRAGDRVESNRDLAALGAANVAGAFTGGYPVTASSSRTAAAVMSGGNTPVLALVAAGLVAVVALFAGSLLENLPEAVLGAVVAMAVVRLIDVGALVHLRRQHPVELGIALVTALAVIVLGVLPGLAVAVVVSLGDVLRRASYPHDAVLGRRPGREGFFDVARAPDAVTEPGLLVYRFDAPLFFANAQRFADRLMVLVNEADPQVEWVVVDAAAITEVDASAAEVIGQVTGDLHARGITVAVARGTARLRDRLATPADGPVIPANLVFKTLGEAMSAFEAR